MPAVTIMVPM
jgi:hypothetical protein